MSPSIPTSAPADITGRLDFRSLLRGQDPILRKLILLLWVTSIAMSTLLGVAAVELNWSGIPVTFGDYTVHLTFYPPLILAMFWLFWFGFWWAAIPTWASTFILSLHYGMAPEWALLFACSDPLGLALLAMVYRALPAALQIRKPGNIALFILFSFAAAVLSSVGAFIWSHATHSQITGLYAVWQGWWLGFLVQNVLIVLPILLFADPTIRRWQKNTHLWPSRPLNERGLRQTLVIALLLVSTVVLFTWLSASLTKNAIMTAAYSHDVYLWQPIARMVRDSLNALMTVLVILMIAMTLFGIYLFRYWSARLTHSHQMLIRSNHRLSAEIKERENIQIELQHRYQMLNLMAQLDARLHAAANAQEIITALSEYLPRQLPQMEGVLCRVNADRKLEILVHWGRFPLIGVQHAATLTVPEHANTWDQVRTYDPEGHHGVHRALPLKSGQHLLGVILLGPAPEGDTAVSAVLQILTEHLALALTNLRLREQLMEEATRDPLTGLYNRRYLHSRLDQELSRCQRHERPLSLMMIDIDHFKQLNDSLGHEAGDQALRSITRFIGEQIRESDIACRFGGEEIILVLPEASQIHSEERARRLLEGIALLRLTSRDGQPMPRLTVSIGLAVYPEHADSGEGLIHAADQAMYRAKANGRNQVCIATG
ncbi:diguanylate cyclase (GGDEF)-like protein [Marinobacterium halophilum]|uniref:diguanylate cyclase n=1 Tax=Marinobacterium halophilum TaxID=267374 RepID=A0A2P8ERI7_9GAMM|nr:GGDEF domain-containing protein [Marinobacterium halophilum]PSL12048.1 diguanylate cyclase (GGDEF)-like protein [Marinobacterium halophilum]